MSLLGFEAPTGRYVRSRRSRIKLIALSALAIGALLLIRGTFAASITLNDSAPVEFGQGLALTTACSGETNLEVTAQSNFVNSNGGGEFKFTSVRVQNIPAECFGKQFKITAHSTSGGGALALFDTSETEVIVNDYSGDFSTPQNGLTVSTVSSSEFTAIFDIPVADAGDVEILTIESTEAPERLTVGSFDIVNSSINVTASPEITGPGTGAYTVEGWYKFTGAPAANALLARSNGLAFFINSTLSEIRLQEWGDDWENGPTFSITGITLNNWVHLAVSRNSNGDTSVWVNGTRTDVSKIDLINYNYLPNTFPGGSGAGGAFTGRISNIRVTNTSVYDPTSASITVPIAPLETISGTKLLLPAYVEDLSRDLSGDARYVTGGGVASIDSPF